MADRVENLEDVKKARLEEKNKRRKQKINQLIMQKRKVDTHQDELNNSKNVQIQEEIEVEKEEVEKKRIMFLTKHHNIKYRRSKKKCWCCKSTQHFKKNCPKLKCFYCKKRGHLKAHCFQKQIFELLKKMGMMIKKKEEKKKEKKEKKKKRRR